MSVLGWFELPEDQVPPEEYWHSPDLIEDWFKAVKRRQENRSKGFESIEESDGDESYVDEEVAALRG
jgi:hypothetical protein